MWRLVEAGKGHVVRWVKDDSPNVSGGVALMEIDSDVSCDHSFPSDVGGTGDVGVSVAVAVAVAVFVAS